MRPEYRRSRIEVLEGQKAAIDAEISFLTEQIETETCVCRDGVYCAYHANQRDQHVRRETGQWDFIGS